MTAHTSPAVPSFLVEFYDTAMKAADERTKDWPLIESPVPTVVTVAGYFFIVWAGPKVMENRKPVNLGHLLTAYNFLLVALSSYMTYEFAMSAYLAGYSLGCQSVDYSWSPLALRVFFILRKKNNQLTFLHVFHHGTMIFNWWLCVRFVPGGCSFFHAMLNSFVHVIMYSYYGLSALGPRVQPFLWWKRYVTWIQVTQFVVVLIHSLNIALFCDFNKFLSGLASTYAIIMIVLFSNYYYQQFMRSKKTKTTAAKTPQSSALSVTNNINNNNIINNKHSNGAKSETRARKRVAGSITA
ncbi:elongation of very long chain fatty acids protein [Elysia marginata]|uniref:Elongation of very long chain fatty acids protein n=1 Tax=Elysia marginata TaxID=1093978 RepID=A0AAV4J1N4_9GAST|nr:elongation of very long chain fatty acids protein [Elysia marginata]